MWLKFKNFRLWDITNMLTKALKEMESREKGQTVIETVMMLFVLILIFFVIAEFGRAWYVKNSLNNAARIGARYAAVTPNLAPNDVRVETKVVDQPGVPDGVAVLTNYTAGAVTVNVSVDLSFIPLVPGLGDITNISSEATMRYERD